MRKVAMMKQILLALVLTVPLPAIAEEAKVSISVSLIEEVFRSLAARPYSDVAGTISKLQAEVQHQTAPAAPVAPTTGPAPEDKK